MIETRITCAPGTSLATSSLTEADLQMRYLTCSKRLQLRRILLRLASTWAGPTSKTSSMQLLAAELEAYAQIDPANDRVHFLLGNAYRGLGRIEDARKEFQTYQELSRQRLRRVQQDVKSVTEDVNRSDP